MYNNTEIKKKTHLYPRDLRYWKIKIHVHNRFFFSRRRKFLIYSSRPFRAENRRNYYSHAYFDIFRTRLVGFHRNASTIISTCVFRDIFPRYTMMVLYDDEWWTTPSVCIVKPYSVGGVGDGRIVENFVFRFFVIRFAMVFFPSKLFFFFRPILIVRKTL